MSAPHPRVPKHQFMYFEAPCSKYLSVMLVLIPHILNSHTPDSDIKFTYLTTVWGFGNSVAPGLLLD